MSIDVRILDGEGEGKVLHTAPSQFHPDRQVLVTTSGPQRHGVWKVTNRTTAGTTIITEPESGGAIVVTDIIVSADRKPSSSTQLQFTDGTNTEIMALFDSSDRAVSVAIAIVGLLRGWKNARFELTTVDTVNATVSLGYMKVPDGLEFAEWDALR